METFDRLVKPTEPFSEKKCIQMHYTKYIDTDYISMYYIQHYTLYYKADQLGSNKVLKILKK
jgi:hypothetical protein